MQGDKTYEERQEICVSQKEVVILYLVVRETVLFSWKDMQENN